MNPEEVAYIKVLSKILEVEEKLVKRIEELEAAYGPFGTDAKLNAVAHETVNAVARDVAERERQARWHATYNAAISRVASFTHGAAATEREMQVVHDTVHRACVMYADRAHGPLEADPKPEGP